MFSPVELLQVLVVLLLGELDAGVFQLGEQPQKQGLEQQAQDQGQKAFPHQEQFFPLRQPHHATALRFRTETKARPRKEQGGQHSPGHGLQPCPEHREAQQGPR